MNRATGVNGSRADQFDPHRSLTVDRTTKSVKLPARVSVGTMHPHRDRLAIYTLEGETMFEDDTLTADGYTCVVYLKAGWAVPSCWIRMTRQDMATRAGPPGREADASRDGRPAGETRCVAQPCV